MKLALQAILAVIIGPAIGIGLTYLAAVFITYDWQWVSHTDAAWRFMFVFFAIFGAGFGFAGGCAIAQAID